MTDAMDNAPRTIDDAEISALWAATLNVEAVGPDDNFFALGGDSIMVTILAFQIENLLNIQFSPDFVYDHPTLGEFCACLRTFEA